MNATRWTIIGLATAAAVAPTASSGWRTRRAETAAALAGSEATVHDQLGDRHVRGLLAGHKERVHDAATGAPAEAVRS